MVIFGIMHSHIYFKSRIPAFKRQIPKPEEPVGDPLASTEGGGEGAKAKGTGGKLNEGRETLLSILFSCASTLSCSSRCCTVRSLPFSLETFAAKVKIMLITPCTLCVAVTQELAQQNYTLQEVK